jgi:hypothetical protein
MKGKLLGDVDMQNQYSHPESNHTVHVVRCSQHSAVEKRVAG